MRASERNKRASLPVSRNVIGDSSIPTGFNMRSQHVVKPHNGEQIRKGRARQKIGMWGHISTDYRTEATHDSRYSQTVSNLNA